MKHTRYQHRYWSILNVKWHLFVNADKTWCSIQFSFMYHNILPQVNHDLPVLADTAIYVMSGIHTLLWYTQLSIKQHSVNITCLNHLFDTRKPLNECNTLIQWCFFYVDIYIFKYMSNERKIMDKEFNKYTGVNFHIEWRMNYSSHNDSGFDTIFYTV
jgi:hypothetical protein